MMAMTMTRRQFGKLAAAAVPAAALADRPNSKFNGVQIGAITYSFRALPSSADDILKYCLELGINSIELMGDVAENYAGAPAARGRTGGGGRKNQTPEQQQAVRHAAEARKAWRLSASMDSYKRLRSMYNDAGVSIDLFKLPLTAAMSGDEYEYVFNVTKALGAKTLTMELPTDAALSKRCGEFAGKHKIFIGYHNHTHVDEHSWDAALEQSKFNGINLDVGHFTEAISGSPIPFIKQHHSRIVSFHLKDKKYSSHGGGNLPWGQGETPLKEVLQLMAREKYRWPADIELEYDVASGSSVIAEMKKCVAFAKEALAENHH